MKDAFPRRKPNRLPAFDYSGCHAYFITVRVKKECPCLWDRTAMRNTPLAGEQDDRDKETALPYFVGAAISRPSSWQRSALSDSSTLCPPLSAAGRIVDEAICSIPQHYQHVEVDKYCIMPEHVHLILFLTAEETYEPDGRLIAAPTENPDFSFFPQRKPTISQIIGHMKRWISLQIGFSLWQKSFYDRIIRNEKEYLSIWKYIDENPLKFLEYQTGG